MNITTFIFPWLPMVHFPVSNEKVTNSDAFQTGRNEIQQDHIIAFRSRAAVDLGASSRRVMLARYERECRSLTLHEIHYFNNDLHSQNDHVTWNVDSLESAIRLGLNKVCEEGIRIDGVGIGTWDVDFVLLDRQGQRVGLPVAYRDSRTNGLMAQAQRQLGKRNIYQHNGIQFLSLNTIYQLHTLTGQ